MKKYPLKFLDSYTRADKHIFYGRESEIDALYEMVFQTDILLIYGASGTGKTSLIQCGLASRFKSHDWLDIFVRRGNNINDSLQKALEKVGGGLENHDFELFDFGEEDSQQPKSNDLSILEQQFQKIYLNAFRPIFLIFDQFEELYILGTAEEQATFVQSVKAILNLSQPVKMIFSIREEYLGYLFEFEQAIPQLLKKKLRIEPMNITKVQEVVEGITSDERTNISIEEAELVPFTEQVFKKLQGKNEDGEQRKSLGIELPYLQVFLDKLYFEITKDKQRNKDAVFSLAALDKIGEIEDVLRDFLETQVRLISLKLREKYGLIDSEHVWSFLSPFVTLEGTKEPIRQELISKKIKATFEEEEKNQQLTSASRSMRKSFSQQNQESFEVLANDKNLELTQDLIEALIKSKIIRYNEHDDVYEIAHDALAAKIAEKRSDEEIALLEVKRLIKSQTALKDDAREPFSQRQMDFIAPYLNKLDLEPEEAALIEESYNKIQADILAEAEAQQAKIKAAKEQAKKDRIAFKKARRLSRIASLVALVALATTIFSVYSYRMAEKSKLQAITSGKEAKRQLIKAIKTDIQSIRKDIRIADKNIRAFERFDAEEDVIDFEKEKIKTWENTIDSLNQEINKLEE